MSNRIPVMKRVEWENVFSLDIPETWTVYEEDGLISFFNEEAGVGAMQLSIAKRESPQELTAKEAAELAVDYALQRGWNDPTNSLRIFNIKSSPTTEFSVQENCDGELYYWRIWHVMGKKQVAFITYNCLVSDKSVEADLCDLIINSLSWK